MLLIYLERWVPHYNEHWIGTQGRWKDASSANKKSLHPMNLRTTIDHRGTRITTHATDTHLVSREDWQALLSQAVPLS